MHKILKSAFPVFCGLALLMAGNGLLGTLLGVRATLEGFSTEIIGLVMSFYYGGYLAGSLLAPRLIARMGHIRVFAAMAGIAVIPGLIHGIFIDPLVWGGARVMTGFGFAVLYIVVESWMNDIATAKTRGKILAVYLMTSYAALIAGQCMLTLAPPGAISLFIASSSLVALGPLPLMLSRIPAPERHAPPKNPVRLRDLCKGSPLGVAGIMACGLGASSFSGVGPVYALRHGMSVAEVSAFMGCYLFGGLLAQLPLGMLSDRIDRRKLIIAAAALLVFLAAGCFFASVRFPLLLAALLPFGGLILALYPLSSAYINDRIGREHYVAAGASIILAYGLASFAGPFCASLLMAKLGNDAFFPAFGALYAALFLFACWRAFFAKS